MIKSFIPLIKEEEKNFTSLTNKVKKTKRIPFYRIIYFDDSYEDFDVETSAAAFQLAREPEKVYLIKLCYKALAD
jgi:hypothetical protein